MRSRAYLAHCAAGAAFMGAAQGVDNRPAELAPSNHLEG
jgi:hypothetical protein